MKTKMVTVEVPVGSIILPPNFEENLREHELLRKAALNFIKKVDEGKARSTESYNEFKAALGGQQS